MNEENRNRLYALCSWLETRREHIVPDLEDAFYDELEQGQDSAKVGTIVAEIKKSSRIPLIVKSAKAASLLKEYWGDEHQSASNAEQMLRQDFLASHLYRSILYCKYQIPFRSEYQLSPVILTSIFSHTPVSDSTRPK